jgi:hypothetical protein
MYLTGGTFEPINPRTIDELEGPGPKFLIPCHRSGLKVVNEIVRNMPNAFIQNSVGTTVRCFFNQNRKYRDDFVVNDVLSSGSDHMIGNYYGCCVA